MSFHLFCVVSARARTLSPTFHSVSIQSTADHSIPRQILCRCRIPGQKSVCTNSHLHAKASLCVCIVLTSTDANTFRFYYTAESEWWVLRRKKEKKSFIFSPFSEDGESVFAGNRDNNNNNRIEVDVGINSHRCDIVTLHHRTFITLNYRRTSSMRRTTIVRRNSSRRTEIHVRVCVSVSVYRPAHQSSDPLVGFTHLQ